MKTRLVRACGTVLSGKETYDWQGDNRDNFLAHGGAGDEDEELDGELQRDGKFSEFLT